MQATNSSNSKVRQLAIDALFIALTFVATWLINIRLPFMGQGGLIHLGNVPLFVAAMLFGKRTGFLAGAFGMGLFDLLSGWTAWAPFTFLIVGCMGFAIGLLSEHKPCKIKYSDKNQKNHNQKCCILHRFHRNRRQEKYDHKNHCHSKKHSDHFSTFFQICT